MGTMVKFRKWTALILAIFLALFIVFFEFPQSDDGNLLQDIYATKFMQSMEEPRGRFNFVFQPQLDSMLHESHQPDRWISVVIVKSSLGNKDRRLAIRETWASQKSYHGSKFHTIFLVGQPPSDNIQIKESLLAEKTEYGDILMVDIPDTREHLPLKTLAGMQWVSDTLPAHWIYSSADDDMSLHLPHFAQYIDKSIEKYGTTPRTHYDGSLRNLPIMCVYSYQEKDPPGRVWFRKWYMPKQCYPPNYWPPYCRGGWYSMPIELAKKLYNVSRRTVLLDMDDVWITGLMRLKHLKFVKEVDDSVMDDLLDAAPLSVRTDAEFYKNQKEAESAVIVSHASGNVWFNWDNIPEILRERWKKWALSNGAHQ